MPRIYTVPSPPSFRTLLLLALLLLVCFVGSVLGRLGTIIHWFGAYLPLPDITPVAPFLSSNPGPWRCHWPIPSVDEFLGFSPLPFCFKLVGDGDFDLDEFLDNSSDPISDQLVASSDDLFFGRLDLAPSLFNLYTAGYRFAFDWTVTEEVDWGPWRYRRTLKRRFAKLEARINSPSVPHPQAQSSPSASRRLAQFVTSFNPAAAARAAFATLMYSVVPHNITGRFDLKYSRSRPLMRAALFACAFNVNLPDNRPIIFDSGASVNVTPFLEDFIPNTYRPCDISVK
eukprot:scaffold201799_cov36-Cyclotella_meneghiniana.AAC.1